MLVATEKDRQEFFNKAKEVDLSKKAWVFSAEPFKPDRSLAQNNLLNKWYTEIGRQSKQGFKYERGYYKLNTGCQLLAASNKDFSKLYVKLIETYTYEELLEIMGTDIIKVSSLMGVKLFAEYLNEIENSANERGFYLTHPDDCYFEAMGIK